MKSKARFSGLQLSPEDRIELQRMQSGRKTLTSRVWRRIRVLLLLDEGHSVRAAAIAAGGYPREISRVGKRYLQGGLKLALTEDARPKPDRKIDSTQEAAVETSIENPTYSRSGSLAAVVALVCGPPPEGRARWTIRLLTEEASRRGIVAPVGRETIRMVLARCDLKPWREKNVVRSTDRPRVRRSNGGRPSTLRTTSPAR